MEEDRGDGGGEMGTEVEMKWGEQSMCVVKNGRESLSMVSV